MFVVCVILYLGRKINNKYCAFCDIVWLGEKEAWGYVGKLQTKNCGGNSRRIADYYRRRFLNESGDCSVEKYELMRDAVKQLLANAQNPQDFLKYACVTLGTQMSCLDPRA